MRKYFAPNAQSTNHAHHTDYMVLNTTLLSPSSTQKTQTLFFLPISRNLESILAKGIGSIGIVSKKYRHAGFSCQNIRQLTDLIIVVTKNPAENPAETEKHELKSIHSRQGLNKRT